GEIFEAYGNFYREKQDFTHAEEFYERASIAYDEAEIDVSSKELNEERASFYRIRGDLPRARNLIENLIEARERQGNTIGIKTAKIKLAQIELAEGKVEGIPKELEELNEYFHTKNHYYDEALASMLLAETYSVLGRGSEMIAHVQRALDLSARFDYEYWLRGEIRRNPAIFSNEEILERLPADLKKELGADSRIAGAASATTEIPASITDLSIRLLGPVEIFRDVSKPFAPDAWTTRRARDIFCYIATSKHRRVAKDILIEAFWPDEDPATVEKNFHPTISHIRKALNSRQAFKQNFIVYRDGAYQLNPELSYSIDTEEFEHLVSQAENAKRAKNGGMLRESLEAAHNVYRGEFMSGIYEDWAEERRNFYSEQKTRVAAGLAKLSVSEKKWTTALKYANEVLGDDPFREDMHRLVMKVFASQGKPANVKKHYEQFEDLVKKELGIDPAPETRRVYQELMK
ncbi:MAG TPA: BTAD domain-containing putative transcriptional regulator, partial [Pyrinomonadaceae bacterium]|nr:BTAD domain-containing putative transcriptional regulator [Pyrinomonadaceae bacterium]